MVATMERGGVTKDDHMPADAPSGGSGRILVCDDTEQIRQLIRVNLEFEGYEVVEAVDGQEALEILLDSTRPLPHVITLDAIMPRRDGWWTVSMIRTDPRLEHIPIVMVTASVQTHDRAQAQRAALDGFVAKPFDPEELVAVIAALVKGGRDRDGSEPADPRP
jgi:CheY-like chemotaxis protein